MDRWRGRHRAGLAAAAVLVVASVVAGAVAATDDDGRRWLVVRDSAGTELARSALPPTDTFALRYRNSLYRSAAEEHFAVVDGRLRLVELRAEELAVLEEYYAAFGAQPASHPSTMAWRVEVERAPISLPLHVRATELGRRTLLVGSDEVALWQLIAGRGDSLVVLSVEGSE
ncbi:MAG: hypothetical protein ACRDFY_07305 [Candidatus Limnocylindria bacterium]